MNSLEQLDIDMCIRGQWMVGINELSGTGMLFKIRCKQWDCPDCAKINSDMWMLRASHGAQYFYNMGLELDMVTITGHERHSPKTSIRVLHDQWDKLRRRWRNTFENPQYILTSEVGARGHFHVHFLTYSSPGTRWWKDNARSSGFGFMAHESEQRVEPAKAGFYIGKYLFKQLQRDIYPRGFRRIRCSRLWPKLPALPRDENWQFFAWPKDSHVEQVATRLSRQGYDVAIADDRASWHFIATGELTEGCQPLTMGIPNSNSIGE